MLTVFISDGYQPHAKILLKHRRVLVRHFQLPLCDIRLIQTRISPRILPQTKFCAVLNPHVLHCTQDKTRREGEGGREELEEEEDFVSLLVGALSPVNHRGLHQG